MLVAVEDDGVGRNKTIKQEKISTGIGLRTQKEIINLYNSKNQFKINLKIIDHVKGDNNHTGTRVEIIIPLKYTYSTN